MKYTVMIPVKYSDYYLVKDVCDSLNKKYDIERIYIVTNTNLVEKLINIPYVVTIDEDKMYPGLSFTAVKGLMDSVDYLDSKYAGWCFQQMIKFAFCFSCEASGYLVWDADTYPIRKLDFYNEQNDIITFHLINEYTKPYFDNLKNILSIEKQVKKSFISEHMFFDCQATKEMLEKIQSSKLKGNSWWEKILLAMTRGNGVSEYEIYGNYMVKYHPERCVLVDSRSLKYGVSVLGKNFNEEKLEWIGNNYDCVSFEHWDKETPLTKLADYKLFRMIKSRKYIQFLVFSNRVINYLRRRLNRNI